MINIVVWDLYDYYIPIICIHHVQWIGLWENLRRTPSIFPLKKRGFPGHIVPETNPLKCGQPSNFYHPQ